MIEENEKPQTLPVKKPTFGGRYAKPTPTPAPAPAPAPEAPKVLHLDPTEPAPKPSRKEMRHAAYPLRGTCRITGFHDQWINSDGISSKGRSRMKSRIRYQQTKVNAEYAVKFAADLKKLRAENCLDSNMEELAFGKQQVTDDLEHYDRDLNSASVYHPPTPRAKKA